MVLSVGSCILEKFRTSKIVYQKILLILFACVVYIGSLLFISCDKDRLNTRASCYVHIQLLVNFQLLDSLSHNLMNCFVT